MISRRALLRATLAAAALPPAAAAAHRAGPICVVDDAEPAARAFGALLARRGAEVIVSRGDPLAMMATLDARLATAPRAVCGLGREATRLLVDVTAAAHGLRRTHAGLHDTAPDGTCRHRGAAPDAAAALAAAGEDWPLALAGHVDACLRGARCAAWTAPARSAARAAVGRLHSWLLLPSPLPPRAAA